MKIIEQLTNNGSAAMTITDIMITLTKGTGRQLADVAIVMDNEIRINNIKLINNGKKIST